MNIPKSHPRYASLMQRQRIEEGLKSGMVAAAGLISQGRGEAFDYLLGEKTHPFAVQAARAATAMLILARRPVISVNGNVAALCASEVKSLARQLNCHVEINLFYYSKEREKAIASLFRGMGLEPLGVGRKKKMGHLASKRGNVDSEGIWKADVVFVPLEDGDRTEALQKSGKKVIVVDLNPLSRSAQMADITIVDNICRALPLMELYAKELSEKPQGYLEKLLGSFDNKKNLKKAIKRMRKDV